MAANRSTVRGRPTAQGRIGGITAPLGAVVVDAGALAETLAAEIERFRDETGDGFESDDLAWELPLDDVPGSAGLLIVADLASPHRMAGVPAQASPKGPPGEPSTGPDRLPALLGEDHGRQLRPLGRGRQHRALAQLERLSEPGGPGGVRDQVMDGTVPVPAREGGIGGPVKRMLGFLTSWTIRKDSRHRPCALKWGLPIMAPARRPVREFMWFCQATAASSKTRYIDAAVAQLRAEGHEICDGDIARLSPLKHRNLNVLGRYSFTASLPAGGSLRPLRDPDAAGLDDDEDGAEDCQYA